MGPGVIVIYAPLCSFHLALSADAKHIVFLVYSLAVENTSEASFVWEPPLYGIGVTATKLVLTIMQG